MTKDPERLGGGYEKDVYTDPVDPNGKVIEYIHTALSNDNGSETPSQVKSRYYLQKILHTLFPREVPDMYYAGGITLRAERRKVDKGHKQIQKNLELEKQARSYQERRRLEEQRNEIAEQISNNPRVNDLKEKFRTVGMCGDFNREYLTGRNFAFDPEGNVQFLDNNAAWNIRNGEVKLNIDFEKLKVAIEGLEEPYRSQALKYFDRLASLYQNDLTNLT